MLRVSPGREDEFERMCGWLDASATVDAVIEATEAERETPRIMRPLPVALLAAYRKEPGPVATWARRLRSEQGRDVGRGLSAAPDCR